MDAIERFWEVDLLRGLAIIMMVVFHFLYDLHYFGGYGLDLWSGFWWWFARVTASIFLVLVGVSLTLSHSRASMSGRARFPKYLKRGVWIFSWGLAITLITWAFLKDGFIVFGILHLIGLSVILSYPLLGFRKLNLYLGLAVLAIGSFLQGMVFESPWLLWLGLRPGQFYTLDYFPLFPWFGLVLVGLFLGNSIYPGYRRSFRLPELTNLPGRLLSFLGRHSLLIYLLHQPVLVLILYALGIGNAGFL